MHVRGGNTILYAWGGQKAAQNVEFKITENVEGNIDNWDLSTWNTNTYPTLQNCLKMN